MPPYQRLLALTGEGSAHPGGFAATLVLLDDLDRQGIAARGQQWLDIGCGTGRTACYAANRFGVSVTGIDQDKTMILKARRRADKVGVEASFIRADALGVSLEPNRFDVVLGESVAVFNPAEQFLTQVYRWLKPGGAYAGIELFRKGALPKRALRDIYGNVHIPTAERWERTLKAVGFKSIKAKRNQLDLSKLLESAYLHPDREQMVSQRQLAADRAAFTTMEKNAQFFETNASRLGYVRLLARK